MRGTARGPAAQVVTPTAAATAAAGPTVTAAAPNAAHHSAAAIPSTLCPLASKYRRPSHFGETTL